MSDVELRLQLNPGVRYRCFGPRSIVGSVCDYRPTRRAPDALRADAMTFWCERHAPEDAELIPENEPYLVIELAAVLTLGASTVNTEDAKAQAVRLVEEALRRAGVKLTVLGTTAALMAPRFSIIRNTNRQDG